MITVTLELKIKPHFRLANHKYEFFKMCYFHLCFQQCVILSFFFYLCQNPKNTPYKTFEHVRRCISMVQHESLVGFPFPYRQAQLINLVKQNRGDCRPPPYRQAFENVMSAQEIVISSASLHILHFYRSSMAMLFPNSY